MATIGEQILDSFSGTTASVGEGVPVLLWGTIFGAIIILSLILGRHFKSKFDYDGDGEPFGYYEISRSGEYHLRGNIAQYKMIDDDELKKLEKATGYKNFYDVVKQMRKEKTFHVYTLKITDDSDITDKLGNRARILSSEPLESQEVFWTSQKGKTSLTSLLRKEKTRYAQVLKSRKVTIRNPDKNKDDWYILATEPRPSTGKTEIGFNGIPELTTRLVVREIVNADALTKGVEFSSFVADALTKNDYLIQEKESAEELLAERTSQLTALNQKVQNLKYKLSQKVYIKYGKEEMKKIENTGLAMMLGGMFTTFVLMIMFPEFFPDVANVTIFGFGVSVGIMALAWKITNDKKPKVEEIDYD